MKRFDFSNFKFIKFFKVIIKSVFHTIEVKIDRPDTESVDIAHAIVFAEEVEFHQAIHAPTSTP